MTKRCMPLIAFLAMTQSAFSQVDFRLDVEPILREKCVECHGPTEQASSLRLDRKKYAMAGGTREQIVPGAPEKSRLYRSIAGLGTPEMPQEGSLTPVQIDTIRQWIAEGAVWPDDPPDIHWTIDKRVKPLRDQLREGQFASVQAAVKASPDLVRAQDEHGFSLLAQAALYANAEQVSWLLARGADPNVVSEAGHTPLMLGLDDARKVKLLLDAGADVNARTQAGRTVIQQAVERKRSAPILTQLLRAGAHAEPGAGDPLLQVTRNGDLDAMKLLLARRNGKFPKQALKNAALSNCLPCLRLVLATKPDEQTIRSALTGTATMISEETMRELLNAGADVNARAPAAPNEETKTVLMQTVYSDYAKAERVKLLIDSGAEVNARTSAGTTALSEARKKGNTDIVALLVASGAKD